MNRLEAWVYQDTFQLWVVAMTQSFRGISKELVLHWEAVDQAWSCEHRKREGYRTVARNITFVKMLCRQCQLLSSCELLINGLVTAQLCYKCGLAGSEEGPGLPKEAQEPYAVYHMPASISASWTPSSICVNYIDRAFPA